MINTVMITHENIMAITVVISPVIYIKVQVRHFYNQNDTTRLISGHNSASAIWLILQASHIESYCVFNNMPADISLLAVMLEVFRFWNFEFLSTKPSVYDVLITIVIMLQKLIGIYITNMCTILIPWLYEVAGCEDVMVGRIIIGTVYTKEQKLKEPW